MADAKLSALAEQTVIADTDELYSRDVSEAASAESKRITYLTIRTWLATLFAPLSHSHTDATTGASGFMSAADKTKLDGIETAATADQNASEVTFTPTGDIAASDVQAAIAEVDAEKVPLTRFYSQAGAPAGDPGGFAIVFDTTNNMLYVWDTVGAEWLVNEMYTALPEFLIA